MQSTSCKIQNAGLREAQAGLKIARRNINNLRQADDTTLISKEELKNLLKVEEESEKAGLKLNVQNTKIMTSSPTSSWQIDGEALLPPWKKSNDKPRQHIKKQRITLSTKARRVKATVFPTVMYRCESWDHREGWVPKNWCFHTLVLEKPLENHFDSKIKSVNPKGNQPWMFTGRTHAEAEAPILWSPDGKSQLIGKDPDAGKDWRQEEKGRTDDRMVGWHHWLNGVWASSGRWWRIGKTDWLQSMGSQRVTRQRLNYNNKAEIVIVH